MPITVRPATIEEIEAHLLSLGGGNHDDNMAQVRAAREHYFVSLAEPEFFALVFLQVDTLASICPRDEDQRLKAVAERARGLGRADLGPNWNLGEIRDRAVALTTDFPALLVRDARGGEEEHGPHYLQDGSHRALAYAMDVLGGTVYRPVSAYWASTVAEDDRGQRLRRHADELKPLARLVLNGGSGTIEQPRRDFPADLFTGERTGDRTPVDCSGDFVLPADQYAVVRLRTDEPLTTERAYDLRLSGVDPTDGPWTVHVPILWVRAVSPSRLTAPDFSKLRHEQAGAANWVIGTPINKPVTVVYGGPREPASVTARVLNLDLPNGERNLEVQAGATTVRFAARGDPDHLRDLLDIGILRNVSVSEFHFVPWSNATDAEITEFCVDVGAFCTFATGNHNGVPLVSLLDVSGRVCRRQIVSPVSTAHSSYSLLLSGHTPGAFSQFFREAFEVFRAMRHGPYPWRKLSSYCASIEDGSYLEQKCAATMTALEFFTRTCLREHDPSRWNEGSSPKSVTGA